MAFITYTEAEARAVELGAVRVGTYSKTRDGTRFAAHFFDAAGLEIGFYIYNLGFPLHELSPRREWCAEFLANLEFSEVQ